MTRGNAFSILPRLSLLPMRARAVLRASFMSVSALLGAAALVASPARGEEITPAPSATPSSAPAPSFAPSPLGPVAPSRSAPRPLDVELSSDTAAQFYEMRSPSGETVIARRRFMTTLGVAVYELGGEPNNPSGPTLTFRARLRYDADYGGNAEETAVSDYGRLVPGFSRGPVDLMYGYVEGRRYLGGWLGFKLGRQFVTDALGWWSFDGAQVKVTTPYYVALETYGGLEQRGGLPLATARYERDGIWRGDRTDYDRSVYPSFQPNDIAPAIGAAIESAGLTNLHGRLSYRRVYNTGASNVSQFDGGVRTTTSYEGSRISQERIGYALDGTLPSLGGVKAGLVYDLYAGKFSNLYASVDWFTTRRLTLSADYDYYVPTFDGDSIWNFFLAMPMNDLGLRAAWEATDRLAITGGLRGRAFTVQTEAETLESPTSPNGLASQNQYPSSGLDTMGGANAAVRYRIGEGQLGARAAGDVHRTGDRVGVDVYGERTIETRYVLQGRAGVWHWSDELRDDRDATNLGYVVGAGYKLFARSLVLLDFQHDMNRIAGQRFRTMLWLTVATSK